MSGDDYYPIPGQFADKLVYLVLLVGIKAIGWFVQQHYGRLVDYRLGQSDPAFETLGQGVDSLPPDLLQFQLAAQLLQALLQLPALQTADAADKT